MQYTSLTDAADNETISQDMRETLTSGTTEVWYRRENAGVIIDIPDPDLKRLNATHALLGKIAGKDPEKLFMALQGDFWSPRNEARELVKTTGLQHTSMSVGDVLVIDGKVHIVRAAGYEVLTKGFNLGLD